MHSYERRARTIFRLQLPTMLNGYKPDVISDQEPTLYTAHVPATAANPPPIAQNIDKWPTFLTYRTTERRGVCGENLDSGECISVVGKKAGRDAS